MVQRSLHGKQIRAHNRADKQTFLLTDLLIRTHTRWAAWPLLRLARFERRNHLPNPTDDPGSQTLLPKGPYLTAPGANCGLLLFVPRSLESRLVDELTGKYGFSHVAIDLGERDIPTGQAVMVESTTHHPVRRVFQNSYGKRSSLRVPLARYGVACAEFRDKIRAHLGQQYDDLEALTWGAVDDPARQICSDLPADALPETLRKQIAARRRADKIPLGAVSVYPTLKGKERLFVSPNGFAMFFGAPNGREITRPNTPLPALPACRRKRILALLGIAAGLAAVVWGLGRRKRVVA